MIRPETHGNRRRPRPQRILGTRNVVGVLLLMLSLLGWLQRIPKDTSLISTSSSSLSPPLSVTSFYSVWRPDRLGAVLQDLLQAHAFVYQYNNHRRGGTDTIQYLGACRPIVTQNATSVLLTETLQRLGLTTLLPLHDVPCPSPPLTLRDLQSQSTTRTTTTSVNYPVYDRSIYMSKVWLAWFGTTSQTLKSLPQAESLAHLFTDDYLQFLQSHVPFPQLAQRTLWKQALSEPRIRIALHVRRGDVTPCSDDLDIVQRYLPNAYYQSVLTQALKDYSAQQIKTNAHNQKKPSHVSYDVIIFSQHPSLEPLTVDAFWPDDNMDSPNHTVTLTVHTDESTDLLDIWATMMVADTFVMSKSSFSIIPALLHHASKTEIVSSIWYTDFWYSPLPSWKRVDPQLQDDIPNQLRSIKRSLCPRPS